MMEWKEALRLLKDPEALTDHITDVLQERLRDETLFPRGASGSASASAVLFLMGEKALSGENSPEACLVFNKRSRKVRQPGDLCFPGGRVSPGTDSRLSMLMGLPLFPLARWPHWSAWRTKRGREARRLAVLLATSLRESLEEMRLNPLGVKFLGPLPAQNLRMFTRVIYPMVGWIRRQRRFFPNWEVERIVYVPIRDLLDPDRYACYRITMETAREGAPEGMTQDFPCYRHDNGMEKEILWGATYRIVTAFLDIVFDYRPPDLKGLPIVSGSLRESYFNRNG